MARSRRRGPDRGQSTGTPQDAGQSANTQQNDTHHDVGQRPAPGLSGSNFMQTLAPNTQPHTVQPPVQPPQVAPGQPNPQQQAGQQPEVVQQPAQQSQVVQVTQENQVAAVVAKQEEKAEKAAKKARGILAKKEGALATIGLKIQKVEEQIEVMERHFDKEKEELLADLEDERRQARSALNKELESLKEAYGATKLSAQEARNQVEATQTKVGETPEKEMRGNALGECVHAVGLFPRQGPPPQPFELRIPIDRYPNTVYVVEFKHEPENSRTLVARVPGEIARTLKAQPNANRKYLFDFMALEK